MEGKQNKERLKIQWRYELRKSGGKVCTRHTHNISNWQSLREDLAAVDINSSVMMRMMVMMMSRPLRFQDGVRVFRNVQILSQA